MEVIVASEVRYAVTPDGAVWYQGPETRTFWERYLEVFDQVRIVARARHVTRPEESWLPVTGKNISLQAVPDYRGPGQYIRRYPAVRSAILTAVTPRSAVILRAASQIANMLEPPLRRENRPYGLEVIGDPVDVFAAKAVNHPLRRFFRWYFSSHLRRQCRRACGVAYVTKHTLQRRYPASSMSMSISDVHLPNEAVLSTHYSSIDLLPSQVVSDARPAKRVGPFRLVTVGALEQYYKGTDLLIDAIGLCVKAGLDVSAVIVGEGKYRSTFMSQAEQAGLTLRVQFKGQVAAGEPIRNILDTADLFVLPSRTEGLPRALLEAMARGLPCIGSNVGGIPELLDEDALVPPGDAGALAAKIGEVLKNPVQMERMSMRNLAAVSDYAEPILRTRRLRFYRHVRDCMAEFNARCKA